MSHVYTPGIDAPGGPRPRRPAHFAIAVFGGALLLALSLACGGGSGGGDKKPSEDAPGAGLATFVPTPEATIDLARPTAIAENLTQIGPGDKFMIPIIGVNAPLTIHRVGKDGQMPNPAGSDDVAYYDFSEWPGFGGAPGKGGNAVFSGHVDSGAKACRNGTIPPPCEAVLWDLVKLKLGDEIKVEVSGQTYIYRVKSNEPVNANNGPWDQIVSSTAEDSLTIITCGGDFNRQTREYTNRQVVTAVKV